MRRAQYVFWNSLTVVFGAAALPIWGAGLALMVVFEFLDQKALKYKRPTSTRVSISSQTSKLETS